jgi:micrococcal nuclease
MLVVSVYTGVNSQAAQTTSDTALYHYKAIITEVYDGDTVTANIDLGFNIWLNDQKLRLYEINAPEVRGIERVQGEKSRNFLRGLVLNKEVIIETIKDRKEKYGRYLVRIWLNGKNVNDLLVNNGYARVEHY